jgi:N-acetylglutamate synthase-like GNAT family acetyltransferase
MEIVLRRAEPEDKEKVVWVESKSTPNLRYLLKVFEMFASDMVGEFSVEEVDGELVACGKYTVLPDDTVWLEALRVIPEKQELGLGKRLYEHWLELARAQGVKEMRMYTGVTNVVSSGLAERYGLRLQGTFKGNTRPSTLTMGEIGGFTRVQDPREATDLLMPLKDDWFGWLVMNRTFYRFSPALCEYLTKLGMVYKDKKTRSVVTLGARFMPEQALHIGVWGGDADACIRFAIWKAAEKEIPLLSCFHDATAIKVGETLANFGFKRDASDYIVKGIYLD